MLECQREEKVVAEETASKGRSSAKRALAALAVGLVFAGAAACSSTGTKTEVKGEVISRDPNLGAPDAAVSQFRLGERASYGQGPLLLR
jgi:hypothetical protein